MDIYKNAETGKKFFVFDVTASYGESIRTVAGILKVNKNSLVVMDGWIEKDKLYFKPWKGFKKVIVVAKDDRKLEEVRKEIGA